MSVLVHYESPEQRAKRDQRITEMYEAGAKYREIAETLGTSISAVSYALRKAGVKRKRQSWHTTKRFCDLTGQRFGRLTAVRVAGAYLRNGEKIWLCRCDCGGEVEVRMVSLRRGETKSCGCLPAGPKTDASAREKQREVAA